MKGVSISSHLAILMAQVICSSTLLSFAVYYAWIVLAAYISGHGVNDRVYDFSSTDWIQLGVATALSLAVAVYTALRFSEKLLFPLNSLAVTARRIASGELSARAQGGDRRLTELEALVNDFNSMAQKLEDASGEIRTWNAAIAHELRTPVTILKGRLQGLADGVFLPDQALFTNLVRQTEGLARLIEDLRTLSLAQSGYLSLRIEEVDLRREIMAVAEFIRPALLENKLILTEKLDDVMLRCDPARIRQAVLALLDNARRYANAGVILVSCSHAKGGVIIMVEDEGPGIPDALTNILFDAFSRADDSRSRQSGGSGLGLAVVKAITEAHKGKIYCEKSELGGAAFRIYIPTKR